MCYTGENVFVSTFPINIKYFTNFGLSTECLLMKKTREKRLISTRYLVINFIVSMYYEWIFEEVKIGIKIT